MQKYMIKLDTIDMVKNFVNTAAMFQEDVDLVSGRYTIDAKSIMGIFSLDLSKPIKVEVQNDGPLQANRDDCPWRQRREV